MDLAIIIIKKTHDDNIYFPTFIGQNAPLDCMQASWVSSHLSERICLIRYNRSDIYIKLGPIMSLI